MQTIRCPGCATPNHPRRRHCTRCRERLGRPPGPVGLPELGLGLLGVLTLFLGSALFTHRPSNRGADAPLLGVRPAPPVEAANPPGHKPLRQLTGVEAQADSEAADCPLATPQSRQSCRAQLVLDGDTKTAWCEGVAGPGVGQKLRLRLPAEAIIHRIDVTSGGMLPGQLSWQDVGQVEELDLSAGPQRLNVRLNLERKPPRERIELNPPWRTREVTITLREPHPGRRYEDLICLAEVVLWVE